MAQAYKININRAANGQVSFDPQNLPVFAGDQISWTNNDSHAHFPGVRNTDGTFVGFQASAIQPGGESDVFSPPVQIDANGNQISYTMTYVCGEPNHTEKGTFQVSPTP